jgi:ribosomal protein S18 acetylase RimI-like enzyme
MLDSNEGSRVSVAGDQMVPTTRVRLGEAADVPTLLRMLKQLAAFEGYADYVSLTEAQLLHDGFQLQPPLYQFFVAEVEVEGEFASAAMAMFFFRYSGWGGKELFLEDLWVDEAYRRLGLGQALMGALQAQAKVANSRYVSWQVANWNEPALGFYKQMGVHMNSTYLTCWLAADKELAQPAPALPRER